MAKTTIQNGMTGLDVRTALNEMFGDLYGFPLAFHKTSRTLGPAFELPTPQTIRTNQDLWVTVGGVMRRIPANTNITLPTLVAGTDYQIYACVDQVLRASDNFSAPAGFDATTSRAIGGFHYAPGGNASAQAGGDTTPQINPYSIWDLAWRPACPDPRGMALVAGQFWCDIYLLGVNHHTDGTSRNNATIADGSSPPKVPTIFGGNGSTTYGTCTWFVANEVMKAYGKDLLDYAEFAAAAYGVTEAASRGSDPVTTGLGTSNAGASNADQKFTSKWGIVQAAGVQWVWARDISSKVTASGADAAAVAAAINAYSWKTQTGGRGSLYTQTADGIAAALLGGGWDVGAGCGSRASSWGSVPWNSSSSFGARGRCDHLTHV